MIDALVDLVKGLFGIEDPKPPKRTNSLTNDDKYKDTHGNDQRNDIQGNRRDKDVHGNTPKDIHGNPM